MSIVCLTAGLPNENKNSDSSLAINGPPKGTERKLSHSLGNLLERGLIFTTKEVIMWISYLKTTSPEMRPYVPGEDLTGVSVNAEDTPELGGMIARNADNHKDQWYIGKEFFRKNYLVSGESANQYSNIVRQRMSLCLED